jgi:hypothetical protein
MFPKYDFLFNIGLFLAFIYIAAIVCNVLIHFAGVLIGI